MTFKPPIALKLADAKAEQVRQSHSTAISQLQSAPLAGVRIIANVSLLDATNVLVPHGLGRAPSVVLWSLPRNISRPATGCITDQRDGSFDLTQYVKLQANGYGTGSTCIVDLVVA